MGTVPFDSFFGESMGTVLFDSFLASRIWPKQRFMIPFGNGIEPRITEKSFVADYIPEYRITGFPLL